MSYCATGAGILALSCLWAGAGPLEAAIQVQAAVSLSSPQPVGTLISFAASATDSSPGPVTYRFEISSVNSSTSFHTVRDYTLRNTYDWYPTTPEGNYQIRVTARDYLANEAASTVIPFVLTSRVTGGMPSLVLSNHPLVALFSAPPCPAGSSVRVYYGAAGTSASSADITDFRPCAATSTNFLVAGLYQQTLYTMNYQVKSAAGIVKEGAGPLTIVTGTIPAGFPAPSTLIVPATIQSSPEWMTLIGFPASAQVATAYDKAGRCVWYYPDQAEQGTIVRLLAGGTMNVLVPGSGTGTGFYGPNNTRMQLLREIDLAGNVLHEISADRVSELLQAQGKDPIGRFNHDAVRLPNGHTLALADAQRAYPAGTQGAQSPIAVIGAVVVDFDPDWNIAWTWSAFDHAAGGAELDINRAATLGEICFYNKNGETQNGCPSVILPPFQSARDWTHSNSLDPTADGGLLMSVRNQDWIIKIDYANGTGSGNVLWRMGLDGDFTFVNTTGDPYPWFSHQHDAAFEFNGNQYLSLFDNGNTRIAQQGGHSRGQVLLVDETARTATFFVNADLGVVASAHGSAQALSNGNWHFGGDASRRAARAIETVGTTAAQAFNLQGNGSVTYRVWRLSSFYAPPY